MYKITIEQIEEKQLEKTTYECIGIKEGTEDTREYGYIKIPNKETVSTEVYTQKSFNDDMDIKKVIDAFNQ